MLVVSVTARFATGSSTAWETVNPPVRLKFARLAASSATGLLNVTVMCCKSAGGSMCAIAGASEVPSGVITLAMAGDQTSAILS